MQAAAENTAPSTKDTETPEIWPGEPLPLGANWDGRGTNFSVFSEVATRAYVCLFDTEGRAVQAYTHARYRTVGRTVQLTPWLCNYRDYFVANGVMIPREGEVSWLLPEGLLPYCRLRVTASR